MVILRKKVLSWGIPLFVLGSILVGIGSKGITPGIKGDDGKILDRSIAVLEKVELGGMEQYILIRGNDVSNPALLWLHGGPGSSQMPVARYFQEELEKEFIVVHWDQRGAGKSNPPNFNENTMTIDQFVLDAHELTTHLKERLGKEKIYVIGHSWGTLLGSKLVHKYPHDYYAYVGVSQVVNPLAGHELTYRWLLEQIEEKDLQKLTELGEPPYTDHSNYVKFAGMVDSYGGGMDLGIMDLGTIAIRSSEYRPRDYLSWLRGAKRGSGPMWDSYIRFDSNKDVPEILVPAYFFHGRYDYNTPLQLVEGYINLLDAPKGKELIIFESSSHAPFMGETKRFNRELVRVKEKTYY